MFKPFDQGLDLVSMQPSVEASGKRKRVIKCTCFSSGLGEVFHSLNLHTHNLPVLLGLCDIHVDAYLDTEKDSGANLFPLLKLKPFIAN